jgi:hypothetical protein
MTISVVADRGGPSLPRREEFDGEQAAIADFTTGLTSWRRPARSRSLRRLVADDPRRSGRLGTRTATWLTIVLAGKNSAASLPGLRPRASERRWSILAVLIAADQRGGDPWRMGFDGRVTVGTRVDRHLVHDVPLFDWVAELKPTGALR